MRRLFVAIVCAAAFSLLVVEAVSAAAEWIRGVQVGGPVSPSGDEVACDLLPELRVFNTGGSDGLGLCVFTSIMHSGRFQNERELWDFQDQMKRERGGGWPEKVDQMMRKYAPGVRYLQHTQGDVEILYQAIRGGRMPCITYAGRDPHYGAERRVAHMVNLIHLDPPTKSPRWAAILDNNFPGENQVVWLTENELRERWIDMSGGWAVVLLSAPPMPVPVNKGVVN